MNQTPDKETHKEQCLLSANRGSRVKIRVIAGHELLPARFKWGMSVKLVGTGKGWGSGRPSLKSEFIDMRSSFTRRRCVHTVAGSALGLSIPRLLKAEAESAAVIPARAKSCILFFMEGGPSHIDLWDMKPDAPEQVRGIFRPIDTTLPGFQVCEHLPQLAKVAHHLAVVRTVSHSVVDHNAASQYMLSGRPPLRDGQLIRGPSPDNPPPFGSVLARFRPTNRPLPDYVHLPKEFFNCGNFIPGVLAGFLGETYDPLIAGDASLPDFHVPGLEPRLTDRQFDARRLLLSRMDQELGKLSEHRSLERLDAFYQKAFSLITSPEARRAFRIEDEPQHVRVRYGLRKPVSDVRGNGLPHLGQSFLLARRLIEAGVRLVSVWAGGQAFDGHTQHFHALKNGLCPPTDQAVTALIEDLAERGLLDETLFVAVSEFGRTPKLGQITSTAGAGADGRDHWPNAFTAFFAGAGVKAGMIHGQTDRLGAFPVGDLVTPEDIAATIYTILGVPLQSVMYDRIDRPYVVSDGTAIENLLA